MNLKICLTLSFEIRKKGIVLKYFYSMVFFNSIVQNDIILQLRGYIE